MDLNVQEFVPTGTGLQINTSMPMPAAPHIDTPTIQAATQALAANPFASMNMSLSAKVFVPPKQATPVVAQTQQQKTAETKPKAPTAPTSFQPQAATFKSATSQPAKTQKYVVKGSQPESVNKHKDSIDDFSGY